MNKIFDLFEGSVWFNMISFFLAVVGILIAIYQGVKSKKRKRPLFAIRSINIISDDIKNIGDIEVKFKNQKIENLTITKIAFWNQGNKTIQNSDEAKLDRLRIIVDRIDNHHQILNSEIIFVSHFTNNFVIDQNSCPNEPRVTFDYIDRRQGVVIKLIHTGKKSSDVSLLGTFKDSEPLRQFNADPYDHGTIFNRNQKINKKFNLYKKNRRKEILLPWTFFIAGLYFITSDIFYYLTKSPKNISFLFLLNVLLGIFIFSLSIFLLLKKITLPKGFEVFFDDE